MFDRKIITYRQLLNYLQEQATDEQLDDDVTFISEGEYFRISHILISSENDVLHTGHIYLKETL